MVQPPHVSYIINNLIHSRDPICAFNFYLDTFGPCSAQRVHGQAYYITFSEGQQEKAPFTNIALKDNVCSCASFKLPVSLAKDIQYEYMYVFFTDNYRLQ